MTWVVVDLLCGGCGRVTYRPPACGVGCAWCGGSLAPVVAGQLGLFATEAAVTA